jgi:glutathione S-transferase
MEATLATSPWLAGETFSLADIAYAPYLTRLEHLRMNAMWDRRPKLADWFERLRERDAYKTAIVKWFNPKYLSLMDETGRREWPAIAAIIAEAKK